MSFVSGKRSDLNSNDVAGPLTNSSVRFPLAIGSRESYWNLALLQSKRCIRCVPLVSGFEGPNMAFGYFPTPMAMAAGTSQLPALMP